MKIKAKSRLLLQNPFWYVITVASLIGLTAYIPLAWWLAGLVTLVWGLWLVAHVFGVQPPTAETNDRLEAYLTQARRYHSRITSLIRQPDSLLSGIQAERLATQAGICTEAIADLVQRLIVLERDELLEHDLVSLPAGITRLEERLGTETDPQLIAQLENVLRIRRNQRTALVHLRTLLAQTELQLEHTVSCLGMIYFQLLLGQSTNNTADCRSLALTIDEAVQRLADHLEALQEVKGDVRNPSHTYS